VKEAFKRQQELSAKLFREREEKRILEYVPKEKIPSKGKKNSENKKPHKDYDAISKDHKKKDDESDKLTHKFTSCFKMSLGELLHQKSFMTVIQLRMHFLQHCFTKFLEFCVYTCLHDLPNIWEDDSFFTW
jgi:hypothetical protein